jgi:hypothetical protein
MPMPPISAQQYRTVIDIIKGGAPAVLMGQPFDRTQPLVPYSELFPMFGVNPRWEAMVVHSVTVRDKEMAAGEVEITTYPDHAITHALGALPTMFFIASPLLASDPLPAGVTVQPLATLPDRIDYWAETNMASAKDHSAKFDPGLDLAGPLPLAVAATRQVAGGEQKAVLFGTTAVASDNIAFYTGGSGRIAFPGNAELFTDSVLWLSGSEHLITVSPEAIQARRLGSPGGWLWPIRILIAAGLPLAVLLAGVVVYLVRRR